MSFHIKLKAIDKSKTLRISSECLACCDEVVCPNSFVSLTGTIIVPGYVTLPITITPTDDTGVFLEDFDASLISASVFPDGIYQVNYIITHTAGTLNLTCWYPIIAQIDSGFGHILGKVKDLVNDPSKHDCLEYINNAYMLKKSIEIQVFENLEDATAAMPVLEYLQDVVDNKDCQCYSHKKRVSWTRSI